MKENGRYLVISLGAVGLYKVRSKNRTKKQIYILFFMKEVLVMKVNLIQFCLPQCHLTFQSQAHCSKMQVHLFQKKKMQVHLQGHLPIIGFFCWFCMLLALFVLGTHGRIQFELLYTGMDSTVSLFQPFQTSTNNGALKPSPTPSIFQKKEGRRGGRRNEGSGRRNSTPNNQFMDPPLAVCYFGDNSKLFF